MPGPLEEEEEVEEEEEEEDLLQAVDARLMDYPRGRLGSAVGLGSDRASVDIRLARGCKLLRMLE